MFLVVNVGTTTLRIFAPPITPSRSVPGTLILAVAIVGFKGPAVTVTFMVGVTAF
jgi:hypothetical protein